MRESPWQNQVAKKGKKRDFQDVVKCEAWRRDWCSRECGYNEIGSKKKVRLIATSSLTVSWVLILGGKKVKVTQSCLTLCDPMDCSPPGSSVHGILQARILEWVAAIPFSKKSSQPRDWTQGGQSEMWIDQRMEDERALGTWLQASFELGKSWLILISQRRLMCMEVEIRKTLD